MTGRARNWHALCPWSALGVSVGRPWVQARPGGWQTYRLPSVLLHCTAAPRRRDKAYISKGYDATTHFETTVEDVLDMYRRITGKDLDLTAKDPTQVGHTGTRHPCAATR